MINKLKGKKTEFNSKPYFNGFEGTVEQGENSKQWIIKGVVQGRNIEIPFTGAYVVDGVALEAVCAGLPLVKDYTLAFEMPDMMSAQAKKVELKVINEETVNNTSCFVVTVTNNANANDKTTLWINKSGGCAEKVEQIAPAMGNAKITTIKK